MLIAIFWNLKWKKNSKKFMIFQPTKTTLIHLIIKSTLLKRRRGLVSRAQATNKKEKINHTLNYSFKN